MGTLTKFGKEIRKLRIERGETMMDMAQKVNKAPSFLSAVETGGKTPPPALVDQIVEIYELGLDGAKRIRDAAFESASVYKIKPVRQDDRELVAAFARKLDSLSSDQRDSILKVLNK